jgi:hypothetical protein
MKWCLVAAGLKDLQRPAEKLSVNQNLGKILDFVIDIQRPCSSSSFLSAPFGRNSSSLHWVHLGQIFDGHYTNQLQSWCRTDCSLSMSK